MDYNKLAQEFSIEGFSPLTEIIGAGVLLGQRKTPHCYLTYQGHDSTLALHNVVQTGVFALPGDSITFEVVLTQTMENSACVAVKARLNTEEGVGELYPMLSGLLEALNGLERATD